ncbi:MAG: hypothetical protein HZB38_02785 [Planctomycetes bacterium]|nr:hypothetical protein [Planctomycetota bacterium]
MTTRMRAVCFGLATSWLACANSAQAQNGSIVAWGENSEGQCSVPAPNRGFVAIGGGGYHSLGLKGDGSIVAWGRNNSQQCDVPAPNTGFVAVAGGAIHSLGAKDPCSDVGDINHDGTADLADLALLLSHFGECSSDPGFYAPADLDGRGCVDLPDLASLLALFGTICP